MPVKVKCTSCEKVLSVPDAARGKAVKCPNCQARIAVPAERASSKSAAAKPKAKKPAKPADSEHALATLDMRKAEDTSARICPKCGYDMQYQDEEDTECPECGFDSEAGGMGAKAKKKAMKGPDPADFYPGLFKESWAFVGRNHRLAWRTVAYTLASLTTSLGLAVLYLWISAWPPRVFLALCFTISFLVTPGWMWVLDTEVIKLTLERKDKFKKLNFDFFLSSAMGMAFVIWSCIVALPLIFLPAAVGYFVVNYFGGNAAIVFPICIAIGILPSIWMLPVAMSHIVMPVQYKGWLVWKLVPLWARNIKPLSIWLLWFLITNIPSIAGIATIAVVYGPGLVTMTESMEKNASISRQMAAAVENPNAKVKSKGPPKAPKPQPPKATDKVEVDFTPLIVPGVILAVMCVINGFTCMFNMRTNGRFAYYFKSSLDLIDKKKEYKYIAKEKVDEDAEQKPKTTSQLFVDAVAFFLVFDMLGVVGGMLFGSLSSFGMMRGIYCGLCVGQSIALFCNFVLCVKLAFGNSLKWGAISLFGLFPIGFIVFVFQAFEERKGAFFQVIVGTCLSLILSIVALTTDILEDPNKINYEDVRPPAAQQPADAEKNKTEVDKADAVNATPAAEPAAK